MKLIKTALAASLILGGLAMAKDDTKQNSSFDITTKSGKQYQTYPNKQKIITETPEYKEYKESAKNMASKMEKAIFNGKITNKVEFKSVLEQIAKESGNSKLQVTVMDDRYEFPRTYLINTIVQMIDGNEGQAVQNILHSYVLGYIIDEGKQRL